MDLVCTTRSIMKLYKDSLKQQITKYPRPSGSYWKMGNSGCAHLRLSRSGSAWRRTRCSCVIGRPASNGTPNSWATNPTLTLTSTRTFWEQRTAAWPLTADRKWDEMLWTILQGCQLQGGQTGGKTPGIHDGWLGADRAGLPVEGKSQLKLHWYIQS